MEQFFLKTASMVGENPFISIIGLLTAIILVFLLQRINALIQITRKVAKEQADNTTRLTDKITTIENENDKQLMTLNHILTAKTDESKPVAPVKLLHLPKVLEQWDVSFNKIEVPATVVQGHDVVKSTVASAIPITVLNAYQRYGATGLYEATAPIETLMRYKDGTLSSIVLEQKGGRIQTHSGFEEAKGLWSPALVFQLLSIVTAQYYLNGITKQLNEIGSKLKVLIHLHHNEKISKLQADYERLSELSRKGHYEIEDLVEIRACINSAYSIHREYTNLIQKTNLKDFRKSIEDALIGSSSEHLAKLEEMHGDTKFNVDLLIFSRRVLYSAKLIELKANVYMSERSPERTKNIPYIVDDLQEIMREYRSSDSNLAEKIRGLLAEHSHAALDIKKDAWAHSNEMQAKRLASKYSSETDDSIKEIADLAEDVEKTYKTIKGEISKEKKMYILVDEDGRQHPLIPNDSKDVVVKAKKGGASLNH